MEDLLEVYNRVNNFGRLLEMEFEVSKLGYVIYRMAITEKILATKTTAHGGAIAGFMDAVAGVAALSAVAQERKLVSTVEYKINYLRPAYLGDQLKGIGKVLSKGKRIIVSQGEIFNQKNELIATALGTFNAYPFEKSDVFKSQ